MDQFERDSILKKAVLQVGIRRTRFGLRLRSHKLRCPPRNRLNESQLFCLAFDRIGHTALGDAWNTDWAMWI